MCQTGDAETVQRTLPPRERTASQTLSSSSMMQQGTAFKPSLSMPDGREFSSRIGMNGREMLVPTDEWEATLKSSPSMPDGREFSSVNGMNGREMQVPTDEREMQAACGKQGMTTGVTSAQRETVSASRNVADGLGMPSRSTAGQRDAVSMSVSWNAADRQDMPSRSTAEQQETLSASASRNAADGMDMPSMVTAAQRNAVSACRNAADELGMPSRSTAAQRETMSAFATTVAQQETVSSDEPSETVKMAQKMAREALYGKPSNEPTAPSDGQESPDTAKKSPVKPSPASSCDPYVFPTSERLAASEAQVRAAFERLRRKKERTEE